MTIRGIQWPIFYFFQYFCEKEVTCIGYNYNHSTYTCELMDAITTTSAGVGWQFFDPIVGTQVTPRDGLVIVGTTRDPLIGGNYPTIN
jgi:hypothetical protein